ncbi:MAG: Uma2 family endonuclease [Halothece sp.]
MIPPSVERKKYPPQQYLEWEVNSPERHEYINGEIIPMAGETPNHNWIVGNLYISLKLGLQETNYDIFFSDQRVWIPEKNIYTYPDIFIVKGDLELQVGRNDTVMNPCFIAEVLSDSTQYYDKNDKFQAYRTIPTFQEYVLIEQSCQQVEHYQKVDTNQWLLTEYQGTNSILDLVVGNMTIPLADIYDKVTFE